MQNCAPTETPDVDIPALRAKYLSERDKRLRPEGQKQYLEAEDDFAEFYEGDPHTPVVPRDPISDEIDVAVLGGGFAGLIAARRLSRPASRTSGSSSSAATSAASGTGTATPASSATTTPTATSRCSKRLATCRRRSSPTATRSSSTASASASIRALRAARCSTPWCASLRLGRGDQALADHAPTAATTSARASSSWRGPVQPAEAARHPRHQGLQGPHLPHRPLGLRLHRRRRATAGWTSSPTSGSRVIGTGASGVQVIPHLGRDAKHLYVFQRTPSSVDERGNRPDRSANGRDAEAGLAGGAAAQLPQRVAVRGLRARASRT